MPVAIALASSEAQPTSTQHTAQIALNDWVIDAVDLQPTPEALTQSGLGCTNDCSGA